MYRGVSLLFVVSLLMSVGCESAPTSSPSVSVVGMWENTTLYDEKIGIEFHDDRTVTWWAGSSQAPMSEGAYGIWKRTGDARIAIAGVEHNPDSTGNLLDASTLRLVMDPSTLPSPQDEPREPATFHRVDQ